MNSIHVRKLRPAPLHLVASVGIRQRQRACAVALALALYLLQLNRAAAQNHVDYRYENYQEDGGRMGIDTHSALFEVKPFPWLSVLGEAVYDAISGATPTGAPPATDIHIPFPPPGPYNNTVPLTHMHDRRYAGNIEPTLSFGPHHITPQFSYSEESDYISYGAALNYSLDLNQKNTTLNLGWAHDFDTILATPFTYIYRKQDKNTDNFLVGVNQLLGPKTVLTLDFTFRNSHGYLDDPYRGVFFNGYPQADLNNPILFPEHRPDYKYSYIGYASLLQYVTPLHGSLEGSYRFSDDTWGVRAHTVALSWHQKIGRIFLLSPVFRYYYQTAATFYGSQFVGDPSNPFSPLPPYYSADYRLSRMETFTFGIEASARVTEWLTLDLAYKRYLMRGLDGVTSQSAYPQANIVTVGARLWF